MRRSIRGIIYEHATAVACIHQKTLDVSYTYQVRSLPLLISMESNATYSIVNDNRNHDLIRWLDEENGDTICIPNVFAFSNRILPHYFKHSNWQSFVRQLNSKGSGWCCWTRPYVCTWPYFLNDIYIVYGFRRVYTSSKLNILQATSDTTSDDTDYRLKTSSSSTTSTSASSSIHTFRSSPVYLFKNDRFKRNDPTQLHSIRRKVGTASAKAQQLQEEGEQQKPKSSVANQTAAIESNKAEGRVGNKFNDLKQRVRDIEAMHKSIVEETERIHKIQRQQHDVSAKTTLQLYLTCFSLCMQYSSSAQSWRPLVHFKVETRISVSIKYRNYIWDCWEQVTLISARSRQCARFIFTK